MREGALLERGKENSSDGGEGGGGGGGGGDRLKSAGEEVKRQAAVGMKEKEVVRRKEETRMEVAGMGGHTHTHTLKHKTPRVTVFCINTVRIMKMLAASF